MSQFALILQKSTRRCTQLTRSSMVASRRGIFSSISDASARKPNSMVAEIRESVVKGATVSGAKGGFSDANAVELRPTRASAASPVQADRPRAMRRRRTHEVETIFMTRDLDFQWCALLEFS